MEWSELHLTCHLILYFKISQRFSTAMHLVPVFLLFVPNLLWCVLGSAAQQQESDGLMLALVEQAHCGRWYIASWLVSSSQEALKRRLKYTIQNSSPQQNESVLPRVCASKLHACAVLQENKDVLEKASLLSMTSCNCYADIQPLTVIEFIWICYVFLVGCGLFDRNSNFFWFGTSLTWFH